MRLGFATPAVTDAAAYLKVPALGIQTEYLNYNESWAEGMIASTWINRCIGAEKAIMSIPLLVGPEHGAKLSESGSGETTSPQNPAGATTPTVMTLAAVAAGTWDALFKQAFETIAAVRPDCILRIGWEQYGNGWYPWNGKELITPYKAAYQHLVTLARTVSASFTFDWNGNVAYANYNPETAYPGDAYCDYMTTDVYDSNTNAGATGWTEYANAVLQNGLNFAASRGKPYGFSEFGLFGVGYSGGHGDDPAWVRAAFEWIRAREANFCWAIYFNNPTGAELTTGSSALQRNPKSAAAFEALFGAWAQQLAGRKNVRFAATAGATNRKRIH